jgi:hypothetical protein
MAEIHCKPSKYFSQDVAKLGIALGLDPRDRPFKSDHPDCSLTLNVRLFSNKECQ